MILKQIKLKNFRNYKNCELAFNKNINIIYGNNGQGKTNILESIYILLFGKSYRTIDEQNLILYNEKACQIEGKILKNNIIYKNEIFFNEQSKLIKVDSKKISNLSNYISNMNVILFNPDDLQIIKSSPFIRRKFLDCEISNFSNSYNKILTDFNKLSKIRIEYLKKINSKEYYDKNYFEIITNYYIEKAILIYQYRNKFIKEINQNISIIFKSISNISNLKIIYKPNVEILKLNTEEIKEKIKKLINLNITDEIRLKSNLFGPQRDDFEFYLNDINLKECGSQGQQRVAILSLKLSEISIYKKYKEDKPIILLDDIFSELDNIKQTNLLKILNNDLQVIITTTVLKNIKLEIRKQSKIIKIKAGKIIREV